MNWNNEQNNTLQTLNNLSVKWENQKIIEKRNYKRNQAKEKKTASSPVQDLHPDWDRIRGTMLYPLSCGELAMKGEQILRLYVMSTVWTTRYKCAKTLRKMCFDSKMTLLQKLCCLM